MADDFSTGFLTVLGVLAGLATLIYLLAIIDPQTDRARSRN